jgi:hypothetical protein
MAGFPRISAGPVAQADVALAADRVGELDEAAMLFGGDEGLAGAG